MAEHDHEGQEHDYDAEYVETVEKDPYHDVEEHEEHEHEYIGNEEILPLGWFEHLKLPSIKSSRQLKAFTEDMILRPANHVFLYYFTSDCFACYEQLE